MNVAFFNYQRRFAELPSAVSELISEHCASGEFILKTSVAEFEQTLETLVGHNARCLGVSSATTGMLIGLTALGIGPGDEVITPAYSYISTASVIVNAGAKPVFVDVSIDNYMASIENICDAVTDKTRAVIAVHLYSGLMDICTLRALLPQRIKILEDSATALGGAVAGVPTGLLGDIGVYSFFPAKPLGGLGDAGVIVTAQENLYRVCKMLRNHGQDGKQRFTHHLLGFNSRMDDINAAFLTRKVDDLHRQNNKRREIAKCYDANFTQLDIHVQQEGKADRVPYSYVILVDDPDGLINCLQAQSIEAKRGFPGSVAQQPAMQPWVNDPDDFPVANRIANKAVALPIYPELTEEEITIVIDGVVSFYK